MATVQEQIAARVDELKESENLSPARVEAVEMTLGDLAARGEWPPMDPGPEEATEATPLPEVSATSNVSGISARVVAALRGCHVPVTGPMHKAIAAAVEG